MLTPTEKKQIKDSINAGSPLTADLKTKLLSSLDDGTCTYNGTSYSPGSLVCQAGQQMICDTGGTGVWQATGSNC